MAKTRAVRDGSAYLYKIYMDMYGGSEIIFEIHIHIYFIDWGNIMGPKFKITFRIDQEEYLCTDDYTIKAVSLLEAAKEADREIEFSLKGTIISIERIM